MPGDNLENCTNGVAHQAESNCLLSAKSVAEGECKDSAEKGSELDLDIKMTSSRSIVGR